LVELITDIITGDCGGGFVFYSGGILEENHDYEARDRNTDG
jgi:hypothetical protein